MSDLQTDIRFLLDCIDLEEKEEVQRFQLDQQHSLKSLKAEGLALHPLIVTRKSFGYADYPEISFRLPYPAESTFFHDGTAIECFVTGEEPIKGVLLNLDGRSGELRLFAPDFPDWIEDDGLGIKLSPDHRTLQLMRQSLKAISGNAKLERLFEQIHGRASSSPADLVSTPPFFNQTLNQSQQEAVRGICSHNPICIVHGPPGTGKTTTLIEAIRQLVKNGEKVLVAAPSNTAVDHITRGLIESGTKVLRVGNSSKVSADIFPFTPEGKLQSSRSQKEIKDLRIRAEEFRKMALKYKRHFGKAEREQRNLLFKEVKQIRAEIRKIQEYNEEKLYAEADVLLGTPVGLKDAEIEKNGYNTLVIDEAGQCLEPLAWCVIPLSQKLILAGDHWQLPPTILSEEAIRKGFNRSILEVAVSHCQPVYLLNVQYRMREPIAGFSSDYFYHGALQSPSHLQATGPHITFIDTAGSGHQEIAGGDGGSLQNEGEINVALQIMEQLQMTTSNTAFITPYSGQVMAARERLPLGLRVSTIDSFQGQEKENIILSLVRSNDEGVIGFLKDYRRMNVAITRAKEQLVVIGDSATIGADPFFLQFLEYVEKNGQYRSIWEFDS